MFDALHTIIGPNPDPWPFPKHDWTMKEILIAAIFYRAFLFLTKGVAASTAFGVSAVRETGEDTLYCVAQHAFYKVNITPVAYANFIK